MQVSIVALQEITNVFNNIQHVIDNIEK